jgi:hypothetical protein
MKAKIKVQFPASQLILNLIPDPKLLWPQIKEENKLLSIQCTKMSYWYISKKIFARHSNMSKIYIWTCHDGTVLVHQ